MDSETKTETPRGWFITFEGGEGTGKSTQIRLLEEALKKDGFEIVVTREPGGSAGGEAIRHVLLSGAAEPLGTNAEAILFSAARSDHVETVIRPALESGKTVLCDRFFDSTRVYQGMTGNADLVFLKQLELVACEDCWPDITVLLDIDPHTGMERASKRRKNDAPDRFEKETLALQESRREAYLLLAVEEPKRFVSIDASGSEKEVHQRILKAVKNRMKTGHPGQFNTADSNPSEARAS